MAVTVRIPVPLQKMTKDQAVVSVEASSIKEMIACLEADYPGIASSIVDDSGKLRRFVNVFVNEENVRSLSGESTAVKDGDEISIIPAIAGGR
ncbi:MAG: MoaD/ThiS family protein [Candidatus Xenobia bacterium]